MRYWVYLSNFFRCSSDNIQGVDATAHERCDRCIDQPVTLELRAAFECRRDQRDPEVPAFARTRVTGVPGTVVEDLECCRGELALERRPNLDHYGVVGHTVGGSCTGGVASVRSSPTFTR